MCIADAEPASAADEVVGAAPAQLEPGNELIRFDHAYYRTAPTPADDVVVCSEEEAVCEVEVVEVTSDEQPTDNTESAVLPDVCDLDLSVLTDQELWDNLEQIIDTDQLLGLCSMPPSVVATPAETSAPQTQFSTNQEPPKEMKNVKTLPTQNSDGFDINSPLCDMVDTFSVEPWSSQSLRNDFETSSSGIGSPFSDELVDNEDYGFRWEESFTELFPALI